MKPQEMHATTTLKCERCTQHTTTTISKNKNSQQHSQQIKGGSVTLSSSSR